MAKGNKEMLATVNFSMDVVKRIKAGDVFTKEEKQETLNGYIGLDDKNNSYWTPVAITNWVKQLLNIQGNVRIADFSAGIGNFAVPFIKEYGKLDDDIQFDLYELDSNTSLALKEAWSDYDQVNVYSDFNSLDRHEEIPNDYDIVLGNPPFSSSTKYYAEWNHNKNGSAKNNNLADCFVDLSIRKAKDKSFIALVLPYGHLYKGNATAKMRAWMKSQVALKGVFPLDDDVFKDAGINGTKVGTCLIILQKGAKQDKVFYGQLQDKDDLVGEMQAMARQFRVFLEDDYDITYSSDSSSGLYGYMEQRLKPWTVN
ncbi:hypothetical protein J8TS2_28100 [Lederbergia ruris]|uniref:site-specific DNA-methyltransferase (adenine-specific) n=1 Tax=Lederbergia ruris TaxID=217495 RepID=A0ABQ4KKL8_9BACI|nr:N-6 DNA methylase [Lederbergia ruris]GIN58491.1 hypothetical protein J8TS2_28100 [Lederbergia ruris]